MKNVHFLPWVGKEYQQGISGKRIMALGESHYCANPTTEAVPTLTQSIIADLTDVDSPHEHYKNTYTKFERALEGKVVLPADKLKLWNSVLFYNYVQEPISGARVAPTTQQFTDSEGAFFQVLEAHQPDVILVWGQRLFANLPKENANPQSITFADGTTSNMLSYRLSNGHTVRALQITHPSAGFDWSYWHEAILSFINQG